MHALLEVRGLEKRYITARGVIRRERRVVRAVDAVSFSIPRGTALGLVGESGCGKTTVGRCIVRLVEPSGGAIYFDGAEISRYSETEFFPYRTRVQMVFQDPRSSLDPRMAVGEILREPLRIHRRAPGENGALDPAEALALVGLDPGDAAKFPHMFSGGQQQRIAVARALMLQPDLLVLDEPTSALDVIIQGRLLNLLHDLKARLGLTYLFVSHDMRAIGIACEHVAVMYLGVIVEQAPTPRIFSVPYHPYTQGLIASMPTPDPSRSLADLVRIHGDVADPSNVPSGCRFRTRCPVVIGEICERVVPPEVEVAPGHVVACHHYSGPGARPVTIEHLPSASANGAGRLAQEEHRA